MNVSEIECRLQDIGEKAESRTSCAQQVLERLSESVDANPSSSGETHVGKDRSFGHYLPGLVATAAVALVMIGAFWFWQPAPASASLSFIQVQKSIKDFKTLVLKMEGQSEMEATVWVLNSGAYRLEFRNGLSRVYDPASKQTLHLDPEKKQYSISTEPSLEVLNLLDEIQKAKESAVKELGKRKFDGKQLVGYLIEKDSGLEHNTGTELWCDPESGCPVFMTESAIKKEGDKEDAGKGLPQLKVGFQFDQPVAASLTSIEPPKGYSRIGEPLAGEKVADDAVLILYPGQGISNIKFGDRREKVIEKFGIPSHTQFHYSNEDRSFASPFPLKGKSAKSSEATYIGQGLSFGFGPDERLRRIVVEATMEGIRGFEGKTVDGIRIGDSFKTIKKIYGKPESLGGTADSPAALRYRAKGMYIALKDNAITYIIFKEPKAPESSEEKSSNASDDKN